MSSRRPAPAITAGYLIAVTAWYLAMRSTSASHLRRLLNQRARRSPTPPEESRILVDAEIERLLAAGLLDDAKYAESVARSLHGRGASASRIQAALRAKGVEEAPIADALRGRAEEGVDPQLEAAMTWARKRRLGPWRAVPPAAEQLSKELARMGRAGFSYELARRILRARSEEELG
jgi:regulatory protein